MECVHLPNIEDGDDIRVVQCRGGARFLLKSSESLLVVCEERGQQLHGNPSTESCVLRQIDLAHATRAQRREDLINADAATEEGIELPFFEQRRRILDRGRFQEAGRLVFSGEERFDLLAQRIIAAAGVVQESGALKKSDNPPKGVKLFDDKSQEQKVWEVREAGLGATAFIPGKPDTYEGGE